MGKAEKKYSLKDLKDALYCGKDALLYDRKKVSEEEFLTLFFPEDFSSRVFLDENGQEFSVSTQLSDPSQRNKVFNRAYRGYKMNDNVQGIFKSHPEVWNAICINCKNEIGKTPPAKRKERLRAFFEDIIILENSKELSDLLNKRVAANLSEALAVLIVYLLMQGKLPDMKEIFRNSKLYISQFSYLNKTAYQLKNTFKIKKIEQDVHRVLNKYFTPYARLLQYVTSLKPNDIGEDGHLLEILYRDLKTVSSEKAIRITGPSGSEKNAITQLLYLKLIEEILAGKNVEDAPFYINFNLYNNSNFGSDEDASGAMRTDVEPFIQFCRDNPERLPVVFVDGIRRYPIDSFQVDYEFKSIIDQLPRVKYIVSVEEGPSGNAMRRKEPASFATGTYHREVKLSPLFIPDSIRANEYLKEYDSIYGIGKNKDVYAQLRKLKINYIDTHQLRMFTKNERLWEAEDVAALYDAICSDLLNGDTDEFDEAEKWAFDFTYTDEEDLIALSNPMKRLLSSHDTFLDYFIARWYLSMLRDESLQIDIINMVMPKGVTRFIVPMMNRSAADEDRVLKLIDENYSKMDLLAQSEMTYWLGRIRFPSMAERADRLLSTFYESQKKKVEKMPVDSEDYKDSLFLLRGIAVSLIVKGHKDISNEYIASLINNKMANEINRGFHLEYYGDKPYYPVYDTLSYADDITSGRKALDQLITENETSMVTGELPPDFELNLFTICSLLQARTEFYNPNMTYDVVPYMETALWHVEWYLDHAIYMMPLLVEYFHMIKRDFKFWLDVRGGSNSIAARSYMSYSRRVPRTGWMDRNIPEPESVGEHMYKCWLMGMMFLPDTYSGYEEYSKDKILNLLLIHDVAEAITGDIPKPVKREDPPKYDKAEEREMGVFLLRGSYPSFQTDMETYFLWQAWNDPNNINGRIAREIDTIQAMFQLMIYLIENPDCFSEKDVNRWLNEYREISTAPGQRILKKLILENSVFQDVLAKYLNIEFPGTNQT